jgi:hypothetical protein
MSWEVCTETVPVIKAVRIGTGRDAGYIRTAAVRRVKCAYLRNANYFIRQR